MKINPFGKMSISRIAGALVFLITLIFFSAGTVFALPEGQQVASGQVSFHTQGSNLTITNSPNSIINWRGFSINSNETVRFLQQYNSSAVLNRVIGQDPSRILGLLQSNGRVFLVNPNGILFGQGARIDVNGFFASTLNISNQDFLGGKYNFTAGSIAGSIENQGTITTPAGGKVFLIAPDIENSGIIHSPQGEVILAAGHSVQLIDSLDPDIAVVISAPGNKAVNLGQIIAQSGKVGIYGGLISQKGIVNADRAVVGENGSIFFKASRDVTLDAGSKTSAREGAIAVLGNMENGTVKVAGAIDASAPDGGDGGFIETSAARVQVDDSARITTLAPYGRAGTWLIDPTNYTIAAAGGDVTGTALGTNLNSGNVTIETSSAGVEAGDITVNDLVNWSSSFTLSLKAHNDINVNQALSAYMGGKLVLRADRDADGSGTVVFGAGGHFTVSPGYGSSASIYYNPPGGYANPTDYAGYYTSVTPTAYMLVNTASDLQAMTANLSGIYALGKYIDATGTSTWNGGAGFAPIGNNSAPFNGTFDGDGRTITGLTINRPSTDYVGLFGYLGYDAGIVRNVGLIDGNVTGSTGVGGLAGYNAGTISDSFFSGTVSGSQTVGGLAGSNDWGSITRSYSTGTVTGTNYIGGLVGIDTGNVAQAKGIISNSYSTASVSGSDAVGGLVGNIQAGTISNSYSTGTVAGTTNTGGLLGWINPFGGGGTITSSYWDTVTSGRATSAGGTGLTTTQLMTQSNYSGWDFTNTWWMSDGNIRPFLRSEYRTEISNAHQLQLMALNLGASYTLAADIDMSELTQASGLWNNASGFIPVGNDAYGFTGEFDGLGHTITGLIINRPETGYIGLFGYISGGTVKNIGLVDAAVTGYAIVGGLAGYNGGTIGNSYITGAVTGTYVVEVVGGAEVGGLVGYNDVHITNCYSTATVTGADGGDVGGLVGYNYGNLINSYSTGAVNATAGAYVGGLVGYNALTITSSYWDTQTSGQTDLAHGGTGKTTAEMKQIATFSGWDIDNAGGTGKAWRIYENNTYPLLRSFLAPATVTANPASKTYNGLPYTGGNGVTCSTGAGICDPVKYTVSYGGTSQGAINAGSYTLTPSGSYSQQQGYDFIYVGSALTVTPASLSVTASNASKTYGQTKTFLGTEFTAAGLQNGETIGSVTLASTGAAATAGVAGSPYVITSGTATGGTFTAGNYSITYNNGTLTISPASLSVTASDASKTYGQTKTFVGTEFTATGLQNGETIGSITLASTGVAATASVAGSPYVITSGAAAGGTFTAGNYTITYNNGALTISPASLSVTAADASKTYGQTKTFLGTEFSATGLQNGETIGSVTLASAGSAATVGVAGSPYVITSGAATGGTFTAGNYSIAYNNGALTISPAALTVTANPASKTYDGLGYTGGGGVIYSGFVNGETEAALGGTLAYGGNAQGAKNAGSYAITPSGLTAGNYTITYNNGALTIAPCPVSMTGTRTYDGTTEAAASVFTAGGPLVGVSNPDFYEILTLTGSGSVADKNVGNSKTVNVSGLVLGDGAGSGGVTPPVFIAGLASNYTFTGGTQTVSITPAAIASVTGITANNKTYDGNTNATLVKSGAAFTDMIAGDSLIVSSATGAFSDKNAGTGKTVNISNIVLGGADAINYTLTSNTASAIADITAGQTVSGKLDVAASGKTIYFAVDGSLLADSATTDAGGNYSGMFPVNAIPASSALLAYVANDSTVKGASVYLTPGGNITNLFLTSNTVTAGSGGGAMSSTTLGTAKGMLSSSDIPYQVSGTDLTLTSGFSFATTSGTPYSINGTITTPNGSQTYNGPVTLTGNAMLVAPSGYITFGPVTGTGSNLTATAGGNITLNGLINVGAGSVTLSSTSGAIINGMGGSRSISAGSLFANAANGIGSGDPLMTGVNALTAWNTTANNIEIDNTGVLAVGIMKNEGTGDILLQNIGAITAIDAPTADDVPTLKSGRDLFITAHSPLTIGSGGATADRNIFLVSSPGSGSDNLTINGPVVSSNGNINLNAGSSLIIGPGGSLSAPYGTITVTEGTPALTPAIGNQTASSSTVTSLTTAVATIISAENGGDENEFEPKTTENGEQKTDENKTDGGECYCN